MSNRVKLKFNASRHDSVVLSAQEKAAVQSSLAAKQKVARWWQQKVTGLKQRAKRLKVGQTMEFDWKAFLSEAEQVVESACRGLKHLNEWKDFTTRLLHEKILLLEEIGFTKNKFLPFNPETGMPSFAADGVVFQTDAEFKAIPAVACWKRKSKFVGFLLEGPVVEAMFESGLTERVGLVINGIGLEKVPSKEDFRKAMEQHKKG